MDDGVAPRMGDSTDSFVQAFLEVQDTQRPKVFHGYSIEFCHAFHPLPVDLFNITEKNFVLISKVPSLAQNSEETEELELLESSLNELSINSTSQELGSPLELYDYQKDLQLAPAYKDSPQKSDENHSFSNLMSLVEASSILSTYNIGFQRHKDHQPCRIWVKCICAEEGSILYRSCHVKYVPGGKIAVDSFYVTSQGKLFDPNKVLFAQNLLPLRYFSEESTSYFSSTCHLFGSAGDDLSTEVKVEFKWEGEEFPVLGGPALDADGKLIVRVNMEESSGPISNIYQELSTVERLVKGITEESIEWSLSQVDPLEKMAELLASVQDVKTQQRGKQTENTRKSVFDIRPCPDVDFTDEVWNVIKGCSSYQELLDCFKCLFDAIRDMKIQPLLGSNNKSSLAQLIRSSYMSNVRKETMAWLKDEKPLIMAAEIGIEKLKKDYLYNFMTSGIVRLDQLTHYLGDVEADDLSDKFGKLRRLHQVLEVCLVLDQNLILKKSALMEVLNFGLKHFENHSKDSALDEPFEIPISMNSVGEQVKRLKPTTWKCRVEGKLRSGDNIQGCLLLTKSPVFPNRNILREPPAEDGQLYYYVTVGNETVSCF